LPKFTPSIIPDANPKGRWRPQHSKKFQVTERQLAAALEIISQSQGIVKIGDGIIAINPQVTAYLQKPIMPNRHLTGP